MLAVETKTKLNASVEWAIGLRHNLLARGVLPDTKFFLIATPDRFFIWKNAEVNSTGDEPTQIIDSKLFLAPYFMRAGITSEDISGSSFELIIISWLSELLYSGITLEQVNGSYQELADSGLQEAIRGGHLSQEVLV